MGVGPLTKIVAKSAEELCGRFELGEQARTLLRPGLNPAAYMDALLDKQCFQDATRFLAHGLPKREAVWWACQCATAVAGQGAPPPVAAAIKAVQQWVADPSEDHRRAAMTAAEAATFGTPAGCAALAAFFSGGSLGPDNVAPIPPPDKLTADAVAGAVMLAVVAKEPTKAVEKYRGFLSQGIEIANGKNLWK
jgi:hypothetical protein